MDAGLKAGDCGQEIWMRGLGVKFQRHPDFCCIAGKVEPSRHYADDLHGGVVQHHHLADHLPVLVEVALPKAVAQHADIVPALRVFINSEGSPEYWINTKYLEEICRRLGCN